MANPWLGIPLDAYESHMALPQVGQAVLLSDSLHEAVSAHRPGSVVVIGCAGGNGFDRLSAAYIDRVVGVDINPGFLGQVGTKFGRVCPALELVCADVERESGMFRPVELAFAGLLLEYVDIDKALPNIRRMLIDGGHLVAVIQKPGSIAEVTPSRCAPQLKELSSIFRLVDADDLAEQARRHKLEPLDSRSVGVPGGKQFRLMEFRAVPGQRRAP